MRRGFLLTYVGNAPERMPENFADKKYSSQGEGGTLDGAISLYSFFNQFQVIWSDRHCSFERLRKSE
jgi:hypothetical protein